MRNQTAFHSWNNVDVIYMYIIYIVYMYATILYLD